MDLSEVAARMIDRSLRARSIYRDDRNATEELWKEGWKARQGLPAGSSGRYTVSTLAKGHRADLHGP